MQDGSPRMLINLDKIRYNTCKVVELCHNKGIEVLGVTKGFSAIAPIVSAIIDGGVDGLADARTENIIQLRELGFTQPITLLRIPRLSNVASVVQYSTTSVNSEIAVITALSQAALEYGTIHEILLMVELGDLREGVLVENVLDTIRQVADLPGIKIAGLGTNMGCFGGILPEAANLGTLVRLTHWVNQKLGLDMEVISGGGTSTLLLIEQNKIPDGINQVRIGEGILLGTDTTNQRKIPGLYYDAFMVEAEVIEVKAKPSVPIGNIGKDAFGNTPEFVDMGIRDRAIVALGRQDVNIDGISPVDPSMKILGASSDHLIVDITDANEKVSVGENISFHLSYSGLLSVSQSKYVSKVYLGGRP